jgi:hypothetical protein
MFCIEITDRYNKSNIIYGYMNIRREDVVYTTAITVCGLLYIIFDILSQYIVIPNLVFTAEIPFIITVLLMVFVNRHLCYSGYFSIFISIGLFGFGFVWFRLLNSFLISTTVLLYFLFLGLTLFISGIFSYGLYAYANSVYVFKKS